MSSQPSIWIVGGGSGIGAAVAKRFAAAGWRVAISGRRVEKLDEVATGTPSIRPYPMDATDQGQIVSTLGRIMADHGRIDVALISIAAWEPMRVADYRPEKFGKIVDTNLLGVVRIADALVEPMAAQGGGQFAAIASVAGLFGLPRSAAYSATKAALISLLQTMHTELAHKKILVRMIAPGFVKSELTDKNDFPMPFLLEADEAADRIFDGLTRSTRFEITFPRRMAWLMKTLHWLPYPLAFAITRRMLPAKLR